MKSIVAVTSAFWYGGERQTYKVITSTPMSLRCVKSGDVSYVKTIHAYNA